MTSTLIDIREALTQTFASANHDLNAYPYVPDTAEVPALFINVPTIDYTKTVGGCLHECTWQVWILTGKIDEKTGQDGLLALADPASGVPTSIAADPTLGGIVDSTVFQDFRPLGVEEIAAYQHYGGLFTVVTNHTTEAA